MPKKVMTGFLFVVAAVMMSGCASTKQAGSGVTTQAYIMDKERVDQSLQGGNQGYLMGTPKEQPAQKPTRKVFVVEFTKELPEESTGSLVPPPRPKVEYKPAAAQPVQEPEWTKPVAIPPVEKAAVAKKAAPAETGACEEYVVKKGDTLQKIAKKMLGSYGKWGKIYQANKEKLDDPDHLKVGMKLCIPGGAEKSAPEPETENLK